MNTFAAEDVRPGPTNSIVDVDGLRVGHAAVDDPDTLSGSTVVLAPQGGAVAGVDVRGGAPGTRETDLLDPRNLVQRVHAVALTGGSAFGLAAADGVMRALAADGVGMPVGEAAQIVPIVPAAVIFDLGRGGPDAEPPDARTGTAAYADAVRTPATTMNLGNVGAGLGARVGGLKGGVGSASAVLADGTTVAALVVVNAVGSAVDPRTGELYATRFGVAGDFPSLSEPSAQELTEAMSRGSAVAGGPPYPLATTIGLIGTDATLDKAMCARLSGVAHDGLARAIRPVHSMFDGDTFFTMATGRAPVPDAWALHLLLAAGADCVTRAVGRAVLAATTVTTPAGTIRSYRDAFPSAFETPR